MKETDLLRDILAALESIHTEIAKLREDLQKHHREIANTLGNIEGFVSER